jgi:RNase P subunit RPR2
MNIKALNEGLTATENVLGLLQSASDALPAGETKEEAKRLLADAEQKIKEAEARLGPELGFHICKRCWPPEIMTLNDDGEFICRNCGRPLPDGALLEIPPGNSDSSGLETW